MRRTQTSLPDTDLFRLDGHCALVTGASGNLGQGIARRLAEAGASVALHYRSDQASIAWLEDEIRGTGSRSVTVQADLRAEAEVDTMFERLADMDWRPDCVVNNAAAQPVKALADMTAGEWRDVMKANLDSAFMVTRHAAALMETAGTGGAIVNIASIEGTDPARGHGHYASSKAGLIMQTRAFALEYGGARIRVNAVSPGLIDRDGLQADWPQGVDSWLQNAPLGRMGTPGDVACAVQFLLSPAAEWISGANLIVDGGMSAAPRW